MIYSSGTEMARLCWLGCGALSYPAGKAFDGSKCCRRSLFSVVVYMHTTYATCSDN